MPSKSAALALWVAILPGLPALAQEITPHVSVGVEYDDNPFREASGARGSTIAGGVIGLDVLHSGPRLYVDADASAVRLQTLSGDVPNQWLPNGYATFVGSVVPEVLTWSIEDTFGQISSEPFEAITSPDRQTVNVLSTGPDLLLPIGPKDHFVVRVRYGRATYDGSNIDSGRYEGQADLAHDFTATARISAQVAYRRVSYLQSDLYPNAEVRTAFLRYAVEQGRTEVIVEGGWELLRFGTLETHSPHVLLSIERRLSRRLNLTAEYTRTFADAATGFVAGSRDAFIAGTDQNIQAVAEPYKTDNGYFSLARRGRRTRLALEATGERDVYDAAPRFNRSSYGAYLRADYLMSSRLTFTLRGGWFREDYPLESTRNSWESAAALLTRRLSEALRVSLEYDRIQGRGSLFPSFKENRVALTFTYDPAALRRDRLFNPITPFRLYEEPNVLRPVPGLKEP